MLHEWRQVTITLNKYQETKHKNHVAGTLRYIWRAVFTSFLPSARNPSPALHFGWKPNQPGEDTRLAWVFMWVVYSNYDMMLETERCISQLEKYKHRGLLCTAKLETVNLGLVTAIRFVSDRGGLGSQKMIIKVTSGILQTWLVCMTGHH